jgi:hypothetical protein
VSAEFNDVTAVEVLGGRRVRLTFESGEIRDVDLGPFLWGPAFAEIAEDDSLFSQVAVDAEIGTIVWPNGADLSPRTLYRYSTPVRIKAS